MKYRQFIQNKFLYLLVSLLFFFLAGPFFADTKLNSYIFGLFFTLILVFSVYTIEHNRRLLIIAIFLAAASFINYWIANIFFQNQFLFIIDYLVTILFLSTITYTALHYVIRDEVITGNTLYGAICGYLLIGLTWSFFYLLIYTYDPNSFFIPKNTFSNSEVKTQQFIYYSFVTITTLGYGDMTPMSYIAKTIAWLEAVTGQIYLTVWIAQLVGLHIAQRR